MQKLTENSTYQQSYFKGGLPVYDAYADIDGFSAALKVEITQVKGSYLSLHQQLVTDAEKALSDLVCENAWNNECAQSHGCYNVVEKDTTPASNKVKEAKQVLKITQASLADFEASAQQNVNAKVSSPCVVS